MVGLSWVKAHVGIPGNELADQQAKLAITSGEKFVIPAPYSHLKGLLKNYIVNKWNEYWNSYDSASGIRVRGYINQAPYTADLQWNRVSNLESSGPKAETLPLGHRGPMAKKTLSSLKNFDGRSCTILLSAPISPHVTLKKYLKGQRFTCDKEVQDTVENWIRQQPRSFYTEAIHSLPTSWD
ncbi:hypothetical protein AVEN_142736-1 [Araneus ventricosus]|uniref:RNase H type-1 domain-containing protein n=1 Tax=Araneus ventricosus TaxID=182803 RepID=A0A4Y2VKK7_ARAVE|nr:hypothetical protein AVEN_142736-1 [Araneus ventricosus]